MERQEMECFLTLADELHFGRTAERLHVSRAHVSQTIQKLERRIGAPLFDRTSRRAALTPIGKRLRDDLAPLHEGIRRALDRAVAAGRGIDGVLVAGFSGPWSGDLLMRAAAVFHKRHPGCSLDICEVQISDPFEPLRDGTFDLQLMEFPVAEADFATSSVLMSQSRILILPERHPLARRASLSYEDLSRITLLAPVGDVPDYWLDSQVPTRTPGGAPIRRERAFTHWQEALALVASGRGAVVSAAQGAQYYVRPGITHLPLDGVPPIDYGLVWRRSGNTARVEAFTRAAEEAAAAIR